MVIETLARRLRAQHGFWFFVAAAMFGVACGGSSTQVTGNEGSSGEAPSAGAGMASAGGTSGSAGGGATSGTGGHPPSSGGFSGGANGGLAGASGSSGWSAAGGMVGTAGGAGGAGAAGAAGGAVGAGEGGATDAGAGGAAEGGAGQAGGDAAGAAGVIDVPRFDDLIVQSSRMSEYEGLAVIGTFDHNTGENSRSSPAVDVVVSGGFTLAWEQRFDQETFGGYVVLFVDREGDGWCTEDVDPAWSDFVNNDAGEGEPVVHDFDPDSMQLARRITCAEFDTWFNETFPGP